MLIYTLPSNAPYTDYDVEYDHKCPVCLTSPVHSRACSAIGCQDGYHDLHREDPINYAPGEEREVCRECWGTGIERWCPSCGLDLQQYAWEQEQSKDDNQ